MRIRARRIFGDPLAENLKPGAPVGVLGIQFDTRRRNRLAARVDSVADDELTLRVQQTFGNCPQYIQARESAPGPEMETIGEERPLRTFDRLDRRARELISAADNFFVATSYADGGQGASHNTDVSHRGGKPGFVRIEDDRTLVFPDYPGNNLFNTIGNLVVNPRAGLLFIDFSNGDLLLLTCKAEVVWDSEEGEAFIGAERLVRFSIDEGRLIEGGLPIRWRFIDNSPSLEMTGSWEEVDEILSARRVRNDAREFRVARIERESRVISSFYLVPDDGKPLASHKAGQFLPVDIRLPGQAEVLHRTYTISNAPNDEYYRLSIKREPAPSSEYPPGLSSNYFHDCIGVGSIIRAHAPRGEFTLVEHSVRPVVLLSGGVGVTPMISMLDQLHRESGSCGFDRQVFFVHGTVNGAVHAFRDCVRQLAADWPCLHVHYVYSDPGESDVAGRDYDSKGHVDIDLLRQLLPLDDYDYYVCGPLPFMQSMFDGLKGLNIADERIHYEFFGPGAVRHGAAGRDVRVLAKDADPVPVTFSQSGVETVWEPSRGSLLDLAESEGLSPLFSCRSGVCSTCEATVLSGDVEYPVPPVAEPGRGTALICCSYPSSRSGRLVLDL